ncbi:hypothetical protein LJC18_04045, partial [Lachnospiraceae bacterium OttesenSCG-928-E19]|nr:hypothetical protein [Lachnospiraceae bacterium OttesenSCG-928-E19]
AILSGGTTGKTNVPASIIADANLEDGQLVYFTQYEIPDVETDYIAPTAADVDCPAGTVKTYRFSKWQCITQNQKTSCAGDRIWDSDLGECVPDNTRRPLCSDRQTAVMVDDIWECIDPFLERNCPTGWIPRLNYTNLEWECIEDPNVQNNIKKCTPRRGGAILGSTGGTLRLPSNNCTDCEEMIVDPDTCETYCVPNPAKLSDTRCYPGRAGDCSGSSRAFYFGFPNTAYTSNVSAITGYKVYFGSHLSQNRKFNCLDCGNGRIDTSKSLSPYIAVCEDN